MIQNKSRCGIQNYHRWNALSKSIQYFPTEYLQFVSEDIDSSLRCLWFTFFVAFIKYRMSHNRRHIACIHRKIHVRDFAVVCVYISFIEPLDACFYLGGFFTHMLCLRIMLRRYRKSVLVPWPIQIGY